MIESREKSGLWSFVYLAAGVDAFAEAGSLGVSGANTAGYVNTASGNRTMYAATSASVTRMRMGAVDAGLGRNLGEDEDAAQPAQPAVAPSPAKTWSPPNAGTNDSPAWKAPS